MAKKTGFVMYDKAYRERMQVIKSAWVNLNEIDTALIEIFDTSKKCGMLPFDSKFHFTIKSILLSLLMHVFYLASCIMYFVLYQREVVLDGYIALVMNTAFITCNFFSLFWIICNVHTLKTLKKELQWIERTIRWNGLDWYWRVNKLEEFCIMSVPLTVGLSYVITRSSIIGSIVETLWFLLGINFIFIKVKSIVSIQSLIRSLILKIMSLSDSQVVLYCHEIIFSVVDLLNHIFGPLLVAIFLSLFIPLLHNLYVFLHYGIYINFPWAITSAVPIVHTVVSSHLTICQINKLNKMIYERLLAKPDDETLDFHLTAHRQLVFSAAGFFNLDNSLICSMIGAGTTYLVILLQYSSPIAADNHYLNMTNQTIS